MAIVQFTSYDISVGGTLIGFVSHKKNAVYSHWGDDIPVTPNPTYFPTTKKDFQIGYNLQSYNPLYLDCGGHGYASGGITVGTLQDNNIVNYTFDNVQIRPFGYGYYSDGIVCTTGNINMNIPTYTFDGVEL